MKNKTLIIVSSYIYNEETEVILNKCLDSLSGTQLDILIVSNSTIKSDTLSKVNYHLYIGDAIMFGDDYSNLMDVDFYFKTETFNLHHIIPSQQKYGLSVLRNLFTSLDLSKSLGYDSFFLMTGDNIFCGDGQKYLKEVPNICIEQNKKCMFYFDGDDSLNTYLMYSEINYFKELIENVKDEKHYRDFLIEVQGNLDFMDVERFLIANINLRGREFILEKNSKKIYDDFPNTHFNLVTGVYNTSKKYNGCLTGLFKHLDVDSNCIGYSIFSRNLNPHKVLRKIKVFHSENNITIIHHELETYHWTNHFFNDVSKIEVYENDVMIFDEYNTTKNYIKNEK